MKKMSVKEMCLAALMAAVLCVASPFSIPVGPIPLSLATLVIYLTAYVLGWKLGAVSVLIYLLVGILGLPVFSAGRSGIGIIAGPTGGYLIGYLLLVLITGLYVGPHRSGSRAGRDGSAAGNVRRILMSILVMVVATAVLYTLGTAWLAVSAHMTAQAAIAAGVLPFLVGDAIKIVIAAFLGSALQSRLMSAGLIAA